MADRAHTWALVGGESVLGRELRDVVAEGHLPVDLKPIAGDANQAGALDAASLRGAGVVFLAGDPDAAQTVLGLGDEGGAIIDLTHAAEDHPRSFIRAPYVEPAGFRAPEDAVHSIAHPAAIAMAMVLRRLHAAFPIRRSVIQIFEPASERGLGGVEELQQQTVSLLSFKGMPKKIFDQQLCFNMLARYGEEAPVALEAAELRMERHLATLLSRGAGADPAPPMPSLRLVQAPVFHGYSLSLWMEFHENPGVEAVEAVLEEDAHIDVRRSGADPPSPAGIAGQGGVAAGAVAMDRNTPQACWCWVVADNLRLAAENAVAVGGEFL